MCVKCLAQSAVKGEVEEKGIQMLMMWCDMVIYNKRYMFSHFWQELRKPLEFRT